MSPHGGVQTSFTNQQEFDNDPVSDPGDTNSYPKADESSNDNNVYYYGLVVVIIVVVLVIVLFFRPARAPASHGREPKDRSKGSRRDKRRSRRDRNARGKR